MAPTSGWFKTALAGAGICSDAYNLFAINLVKNVLSSIYTLSDGQLSAISTTALVGAVVGQLVFGALADRIGRRLIFIMTITGVIIGALGSATATDSPSLSLTTQLCMWLALTGASVGGEYPLSATVSSEGASQEGRGKAVSSVFAMQGVGNMLASLVMVILLQTPLPLDWVWRLALAFGAVPGLATVYWRYQMEESSHFTKLQHSAPTPDADAAAADLQIESDAETHDLIKHGGQADAQAELTPLQRLGATIYRYRWTLVGTAGSWCIFDIVFYANGLFSGTILSDIGYGTGGAKVLGQHELSQLALGNLILTCIGLPGYIVAVLTIDRIGRRNMQLMGFLMISLLFLVLAVALAPLENSAQPLLVFLYGLTFFFSNFGPNMTTFVLPAEAFPTAVKSTCHGLSAASGKIGAAVGAAAMSPLLSYYGTTPDAKRSGLALVLYICAAVGVIGLAWTAAFTKDTRGVTIEALDAQEAIDESNDAAAAAAHASSHGGGGGDDGSRATVSSIQMAEEVEERGGTGNGTGLPESKSLRPVGPRNATVRRRSVDLSASLMGNGH